jgi:hypothetical protein
MIAYTQYGPTDTTSGEIVDLRPLARRPKGRPTKRLNQGRFKTRSQKQYEETAVVLALVVIVTAIAAMMTKVI